jgi:hypothetical protein
MERVDTVLSFNAQEVNGNNTKLDITKTIPVTKPRIGYYNIKGISGANNEIVPDVKIGYQAYLLQYRKQKIFVDSLNLKKDTVPPKPKELDSVRNQFQKIEAPLKSKLEVGLMSGGAIFTGTISSKNLFSNDINIYNALQVNYTIGNEFGKRVNSVKVGNETLDLNKEYSIVACEREGDPEDTLCRMEHVKDPKKLTVAMHDVIIEYLKLHSPVEPKLEERATATDENQYLLTQLKGTTYEFR